MNEAKPWKDELAEVLTGCAQILDVVKIEWGTSWSEWDQSIRDGITKIQKELAQMNEAKPGRTTKIAYQTFSSNIHVYLEGKLVGKIYPVLGGYRYQPKGSKPGDKFATIQAVKESLEAQ